YNSDGVPDLVTANANGTGVAVLLGNGSGGFPNRFDIGVGAIKPAGVSVADVTHDGQPDIIVVDSNGSIRVLLSTSNNQPLIFSPGGTGPKNVALGDFNRDGQIDLAASNVGSSNVGVMLNTSDHPGTGDFQPAVNYATDAFPYKSPQAVDLNGDGI